MMIWGKIDLRTSDVIIYFIYASFRTPNVQLSIYAVHVTTTERCAEASYANQTSGPCGNNKRRGKLRMAFASRCTVPGGTFGHQTTR